MSSRFKGPAAVIASCAAIFLPGSFIFGFPGVMAPYWQDTFQVSRADIGQTLFYVLAGAGIFMFLVGRLQERIGTAWTTVIGALLYSTAALLVSFATGIRWVYGWAFMVGSSSAFVYVPTLTVVQRWYPKWRGLYAGLVSMCFGISGALMAPLFNRLLARLGFSDMAITLGVVMVVAAICLAPLIRPPASPPPPIGTTNAGLMSLSTFQSLRTRSFWLLWVMFACVGAAGVSMVTLSAGFGMYLGLTMTQALVILMAFNITNGVSRLLSGFLSDITGRKRIMCAAFLAAAVAYYLLPFVSDLVLVAILAAFIGFAFGTLFAVSAPLVSDCFGMQHFGAIFGLVFTAFGFVSGAIGPWLGGFMLDLYPGNYHLVFGYMGSLMLLSAVLVWVISPAVECTF